MQPGIEAPPSISPQQAKRFRAMRRKDPPPTEFIDGILSGNRALLSRAITLTESRLAQHQETAQRIIEGCLPHSGSSVRIGITGVPGVGKSTFIESLGMHLIEDRAQKVAVLAVDPSSQVSGGSILGDKTRMERLSSNVQAFIRPSPSSGSLGGVTRRTRESIILCEAAGFRNVFIETVGVGQSEIAVASMVDFFLLLMLAGAGDELQGIKRGIIEMADMMAINKADGQNLPRATAAQAEYQAALRLFPPSPSGWQPRVLTCSAQENTGIAEIWDAVIEHHRFVARSGYFDERRRSQLVDWFEAAVQTDIADAYQRDRSVATRHETLLREVLQGEISPSKAATLLVEQFLGNRPSSAPQSGRNEGKAP
ncbi:MAG: methylmalonyl Co-A mutase-associated GTPase MeaB [Bryobacterales bacterium]|nr:methylmalonyl Co-A mutase-associated GTPase MeaB [Bryobacterales bacterium]